MTNWTLRILESAIEMDAVERLQRVVWPGSETDVVPTHMLVTAVHNGGIVIGAFTQERQSKAEKELVGFVFGFPGLYFTPDGPRPKHCSHMLGVHPDYRDHGLGFALKRAQWQMVRHQGIDRITWTYDPLLSRNAYLNITKLGAVCNTYRREVYGVMRDGINIGLPSDRFEVDWWINTERVERRLSRKVRRRLDLAHYFAAGAEIINPTTSGDGGWPRPAARDLVEKAMNQNEVALLLVEIPADFMALKKSEPTLALEWRLHTRALFEAVFAEGFFVTDFVYLTGVHPRSFYVLSHGESTL